MKMNLSKFFLSIALLTTPLSAASYPSFSLIESKDEFQVFPTQSNQVDEFVQKAVNKFQVQVSDLVAIPLSEMTFMTTFDRWNRVRRKIFMTASLLHHVIMTVKDDKERAAAYEGMEKLLNDYTEIVEKAEVNRFLFEYAQHALITPELLNPYQVHVITDFLSHCQASTLAKEYEEVERCKSQALLLNKAPFLPLKNFVKDVSKSADDHFTLLNLNICFLPGKLVYPFGGVAPWGKRVVPIANKIKEVNADVVCLQEVFTDEAARGLYENLKDHYPYFYISIGPKQIGVSIKSLGLPSGNFVASKYEIEKPEFTPFEAIGFPMNFGFFDFLIMKDHKPIAHLYATHMQSFDLEGFLDIRAQEVNEILKKMQKDSKEQSLSAATIPYILCGDLNIPWGSKEPAELIVQKHFYDDYNLNRQAINHEERTYTDLHAKFFYNKNASMAIPDPQILDYALLLDRFTSQDSFSKAFSLKTVAIPMNDYEHLYDALSDHHGLFSTIKY